jgi:hypothetical protein
MNDATPDRWVALSSPILLLEVYLKAEVPQRDAQQATLMLLHKIMDSYRVG